MATEVFNAYGTMRLSILPVTQGLATVRKNVNSSMASINKNVTGINRSFKKLSTPILSFAKLYATTMVGLGAKALTALYKDNSVAGKAWKKTFDVFKIRLNSEMARIGNLLLKVPIWGSTVPAWMDKMISFLKNMDLSKLQAMVKWFERAVKAVLIIKSLTIAGNVAQALTSLANLGARAGAGGAARSMGRGALETIGLGATAGLTGAGTLQGIKQLPAALKQLSVLRASRIDNGISSSSIKGFFVDYIKALKNLNRVGGTKGSFETVTKEGVVLEKYVYNVGKITNTISKELGVLAKIINGITSFFVNLGSFLGKAFYKVFLPITMAANFIAGFLNSWGAEFKDGLDLIWSGIKLLGRLVMDLVKIIGIPFDALGTIFKMIGIFAGNLLKWDIKGLEKGLTEAVTGLIDRVSNIFIDLADSVGVESKLADPGKAYGEAAGMAAREKRMGILNSLPTKEAFGGQYIGATEVNKFNQALIGKDLEYQKQMLKLATDNNMTLQDIYKLAKGK